MALDEMLKALELEGDDDIQKIADQAKAHENQIIKEAKEEAKRIKEAEQLKSEDKLRMERSKILNRASFQVKKEVIKAKEGLMNEVFSNVSDKISNLRNNGKYEDIFDRLVSETLNGISGKVIVSVDPADEQLARRIMEKHGRNYELKTDISTMGGLQAESEDGRIILNNTIDSRVTKAKQILKTDVLKVLFGDS